MDGLIFFILLVVSILVIAIAVNILNQLKDMNRHMMRLPENLENAVKSLLETIKTPDQALKTEAEPQEIWAEQPVETFVTPPGEELPTEEIWAEQPAVPTAPVPETETVEEKEELPVAEPEPQAALYNKQPSVIEEEPLYVASEPAEEPVNASQIKTPPTPKKRVNYERFIGENLINKIGIAVLVIGIGLFVKYAIDSGWINEVGRVSIGFLCGGVLLGVAYRFRKAYRAFSSVLAGGAIVVFYFTVAIAFRQYNLFGQTAAFLTMVVITAFSVWLSIVYNRRELAILSLIGGLFTPFMVSNGAGNYHVLFTYIAILDTGILTLSLRKQWKELIVISFIGTQIIFWLYYLQDSSLAISNTNAARDAALLVYTSIFYTLFLLMPLVQVFRGKDPSKNHALHISILLVNSFVYLLSATLLLQRMGAGHYKGLLTLLLAVINGVATLLLRNNQKDKILFYLFMGLTIGFVTLAAPMQFEGNNSITLFWATEAVLLFWLFRKSGITIYYFASLILLVLTLLGIMRLHDLQEISPNPHSRILALEGKIFINRFFIARLYVSLAFVVYRWLLLRPLNKDPFKKGQILYDWYAWLPSAVKMVVIILLFYTGFHELYLFTDTGYSLFWLTAYSFVYVSILSFILRRRGLIIAFWVLGWVCYCFNIYGNDGLHDQLDWLVLHHLSYGLPVVLDWISFAGVCGLFVAAGRIFYKPNQLKWLNNAHNANAIMWIFNIMAVISLSGATMEAIHQIACGGANVGNKAAITILWSLCAFVQMWLGMRYKYKTLRIISLSLLGLVLCKLFIYDLSNVSQGAKIIAFVVLGIVLLVLSFLYQKLKKILFDDDEKEKTEAEEGVR